MDFIKHNRSLEVATTIYDSRIEDAKIIYNKFNTEFVNRNCPFCNYNEYTDNEKFLDMYNVVNCNKCNSQYVNPSPNSDVLDYYYNNCKCNQLLDSLFKKRNNEKSDKNFILDIRIDKIRKMLENLSTTDPIYILEIGCGSGPFLKKLKTTLDCDYKNIIYHGLDIDETITKENSTEEVKLFCGNAETYHNGIQYDIILNFELIEHLFDPTKFIKNVYNLLNDNGQCLLTTPNSNGLETKAISYNSFRLLAHSIFPPMHLNAFNTQNIYYFFINNNFKVVSIETPGNFDISMLKYSEEYLKDDILKEIIKKDQESFEQFQYLTKYLNGSSHMLCVFKK